MRRFFLALLLTCGSSLTRCAAQVSAAAPPAKTTNAPSSEKKNDYSQEASVFERTVTRISFENDGSSVREAEARVRVQSEAGVQSLGILTFPYQSATESLEIDYVRSIKPDGSVVLTAPDSAQDMPTEITRQAPFYSDLREKQVAVKGLSVGDVVEYSVHWKSSKPLAQGQFWYAYNFSHNTIVLNEQLQVSVPRERSVKWKSPVVKPVISEEGGRRIFTWSSSQLEHKSTEEEKKDQEEQVYQAARGILPAPDVQLSSFQSWAEVASWYNGLQSERAKPTPEIQAKAAELTKSANGESAKIRAIYSYVSTQFRYIGVAFGIGRYQPHAATEVMSNQYGDCKDKHTLLAALLNAAGIQAYPALIGSSHQLDSDVPSPAQFDHVITVVPEGTTLVWLDSTTEVAPAGYLLSVLRNKPALIVNPEKPSDFATTPADPPAKAEETFKIDAKLADDGTLEGKVERTTNNDDIEILLRSAFRRVPLPNWKDLVQQLSYNAGFAGEVSEVTAGSPEKTDEAFHYEYKYHRKDYPEWSQHRLSSPLPPMITPAPDDKPSHPIYLGEAGEYRFVSRVELPKGYLPQLPASMDLKEDFAEYHVTYSVKPGVLQTERHLLVKRREVPVIEYEAFKNFAKKVGDDHELYISMMAKHVAPASYQEAIWTLPYSNNEEAVRAYDGAREDYQKQDPENEISSLKHAVEVDPKFTRAWLWMAEIYMFRHQTDLALEAYHSAITNDPQQILSYKGLGFTLMGLRRFDDALPAWRQVMATAPDDSDGPEYLGSTLFALKRYGEAASAIESAIKLGADQAPSYLQLGSAYLRNGNEDKALTAYSKVLELDSTPLMFNDIGYELADDNKQLPLALEYAQKAVRGEEEASANIKFADLKTEDLAHTGSLTAYWDTLGWAYFRTGKLDLAEKYLNAAWLVSQAVVIGDHLGQVYEQQQKKAEAVHMYRLALAAARRPDLMTDTKARLERAEKESKTDPATKGAMAGEDLSELRTVKLPAITSESVSAEFFLLFGPGSKVQEVKFVSGSEKLKSADKALSAALFDMPFPDDGPTRLVRRGVLSCSSISGCVFVLYTPDSVRSVN